MATDYGRLVAKVDETSTALTGRLRASMSCAPGCASCCHVELTVVGVEADAIEAALAALPADARRTIAERAEVPDGRCVMLGTDDLCAVFEARPIVCRTQGLPLLYPSDLVPVEAVLLRTERGAITACPLNFRDAPPRPADAIDAERMDTMLGLVDQLDARSRGSSARPRVALRDLARR